MAEGDLMAPCIGLLLTPDELKKKYPKYYKEMERIRLQEGDIKEAVRALKHWPRIRITEDFKHKLKIPKVVAFRGPPFIGPQIFITSAKSPQSFTFQLVQTGEKLKELETHMKIYYEDPESNNPNPKFGMAFGIFEGCFYSIFSRRLRRWVRCRCMTNVPIVSMTALATMMLIDYGCTEVTSSNTARPLIPTFCQLPAQGYTASLVHVTSHRMTERVCQEFRELVVGKIFHCYVVYFKRDPLPEDMFPHATLVLKMNPEERKVIVGESNSTDSFKIMDQEMIFSSRFQVLLSRNNV